MKIQTVVSENSFQTELAFITSSRRCGNILRTRLVHTTHATSYATSGFGDRNATEHAKHNCVWQEHHVSPTTTPRFDTSAHLRLRDPQTTHSSEQLCEIIPLWGASDGKIYQTCVVDKLSSSEECTHSTVSGYRARWDMKVYWCPQPTSATGLELRATRVKNMLRLSTWTIMDWRKHSSQIEYSFLVVVLFDK